MHSQDLSQPPYDFVEGATLLVNKPAEWTSFDVVNKIRFKIRYRLGIKKIKVGHAGTLDPLATGLLLICTGRNTKKLAGFQGLEKEYTGTICTRIDNTVLRPGKHRSMPPILPTTLRRK